MGVGNHYTEIANVFLKFKKKILAFEEQIRNECIQKQKLNISQICILKISNTGRFPVKFAKFLRTSILKNISKWLLLQNAKRYITLSNIYVRTFFK